MRIMKTPDDLDPFESDQIELTRKLDANGQGSVNLMCKNAMSVATRAMSFGSRFSLSELQRAAYEANVQASAPDASFQLKSCAKIIFSYVQFLQDQSSLLEEMESDPKFNDAILESLGIIGGPDLGG